MKYKLAYTGLVFLIYILGKNIPLYGIDLAAYRNADAGVEEVLMQMVSGDIYRCSIFAVGIFPMMISGLLVQIGVAIRNLFTKESVSPRSIGYATAIVTIALAILQAVAVLQSLKFAVPENMQMAVRILAGLELLTGVMVILWISRRNEQYGVGGRMVFGLVNILERIVMILMSNEFRKLMLPLFIGMALMMITLVMENAEMRIPVQRVSIHNIYADKNYMAIKLNPAGVMPMMFTSAVFMLPKLIVSLLAWWFPQNAGVMWWQENLALTNPFGIMVYVACEYVLTITFSMIMISPKNITEQFLKSGDSIVNLHAGRDTRRYLRRTVLSISLCSATIMGGCVAIPLVLQMRYGIDGTLAMLPTSMMMVTSFWCNIFREIKSIYKYDSCQLLF